MFCGKCGAENEAGAKFCHACGAPLEIEPIGAATPGQEPVQETVQDSVPMTKPIKEKKKHKHKKQPWIFLAVVLILAALLVVLIPIVKDVQAKKEYESYISTGQKYLEELNYEQAEAAYLQAIKIDPKKKEPYLKLADIYTTQEEYDKAKDILENALGAEIEDFEKNEKDEIQNQIDKIEVLGNITWVVEPTIEADDIFYLAPSPDDGDTVNELFKQTSGPNAIIKRENGLGIIAIDGNLLTEVVYKEIANFDDERYMLIRTVPQYSEEYDTEWDHYWLDKYGNLKEGFGIGDAPIPVVYYYYDGVRQRTGNLNSDFVNKVIPVRASSVYDSQNIGLIMNNLSGKYALDYNAKLVTEYIYDECGSYSDGLLAVCQNGKWGYVDEKGRIVIPIEYDTSWLQYPVLKGYHYRSTENVKNYCYAASYGYVTLRKGDEWELRDIEGNLVITPGIFEKICPVYKGKCWVKKDGKWGVIQVREEAEYVAALSEDELLSMTEEAAGCKMESHLYVDMDQDGACELIGTFCDSNGIYKTWYCSSNGEICEMVNQNVEGMDASELIPLKVNGNIHVAVNAYRTMGTGKNFSILALENGIVSAKLANVYGYVNMTDAEDITLNVEDYDGVYDPSTNSLTLHTYKDTYLFYEEGKYKEYGATEISENTFMNYINAKEIKQQIKNERTDSDTKQIEFTYFRRKNGIIHIQCDVKSSTGEIFYGYYTVRYTGNSLNKELGNYISGRMAPTFSQLEVVY